MRRNVLFWPWERLDHSDLQDLNDLTVLAEGRLARFLGDKIRQGVHFPAVPTSARAPFTFARGCVVSPGSITVDTSAGTVRLWGEWTFLFANANGQTAFDTLDLDIVVADGWVNGQWRLIMVRPIWGNTSVENRVFVDSSTGAEYTQSVATRSGLTAVQATVVTVPRSSPFNIANWWADAITAKENEGWEWAVMTYGDSWGTYEVFPVIPLFYYDDGADNRLLTSVSQVLHALVYQMDKTIFGPFASPGVQIPYRWTLPPPDSIQGLRDRSVLCALTIWPNETYRYQYGVSSVTKTSGAAQWIVTKAEETEGRWFSTQFRAGPTATDPAGPAICVVDLLSESQFRVTLKVWTGSSWTIPNDLPAGLGLDVVQYR